MQSCVKLKKSTQQVSGALYSSGKGSLLAFQRVLNDSCEPEGWYIQRTDKENTIYLVLRVSCYQSSAK